MLKMHYRQTRRVVSRQYLSAYARQPARGPTKWAHFVVMLAYVGLCLSILRAMWAHLVAMLAYVGLCWAIVAAMGAPLVAMFADGGQGGGF
jgi:hypothetical protein